MLQPQKIDQYSEYSVLIVDDFPAMVKTISSMLYQMGFKQVYSATNGKEALTVLEQTRISLIISDWNMPKMTGIELLNALRRGHSEQADIPFIMLTANVDQNDVRYAIESGVSEYLIKPFNQSILKDKVNQAFAAPVRKPFSSSKPEKIAKSLPQKSEIKGTILIVDDVAENIAVLTELLKAQYKLKACLSGRKAIQICQSENPPDLILLDIMMPEVDGLEVCKLLKSDPLTEYIPIIFITALSQEKDIVKGLSLGAVDYISKPISPEIAKARIATHMNQVTQRKNMAYQLDTLIENARLKEEIERIVHHDFKGPLSAIFAATELIESRTNDCPQEVGILKDSANSILQMIDNQSLIYQLENQTVTHSFHKLNICDLVEPIFMVLEGTAKNKQVSLVMKLSDDLDFIGDKVLANNLFYNLIGNAIDAAPEKSKVHITHQQEAEWLTVNIHNLGMIPFEIQPAFFDKFITHGKHGGTGIGTYSAKLSAKAMGGDISFVTDKSRGTILSVKLKRS